MLTTLVEPKLDIHKTGFSFAIILDINIKSFSLVGLSFGYVKYFISFSLSGRSFTLPSKIKITEKLLVLNSSPSNLK